MACGRRVRQLVQCEAEPFDVLRNARPMFSEKFLALALKQSFARAAFYKHSEPAPFFDEPFIDQFLISFQNGEGIHSIIRGHRSDRGQWIFFFQNAVENHVDHAIAKLAINRLTVIPFPRHLEASGRTRSTSSRKNCSDFRHTATRPCSSLFGWGEFSAAVVSIAPTAKRGQRRAAIKISWKVALI